MGVSSRGLFGFIARLRPPPPADSDADLLEQFVRTADQTAFTGLVRRHGPMVLSVCQRRLGAGADAEDAFQAVFLALATSARAIRRRESLSGWLYRVAHQIALKAAGRRARRPVAALTTEVPMPDPPPAPWETDELRAVIDAEVAGLSDAFRAVIVLCLIEGRTNVEAAAVLGVPVGTVDSRLSTARKKLQGRLTRRGVAVGAGIALEQMLGGPLGAAGPRLLELISGTASAVLTEVTGPGSGVVSPVVAELARGVTMTTNLRVLVTLGLAFGLLGSAGAGLYFAPAAEPVPSKAGERKSAPEVVAAPVANRAAPVPVLEENADAPTPIIGAPALLKLAGAGLEPDGTTLQDVLNKIESQTELVVRVDVAAFRRLGALGPNGEGDGELGQLLKVIYETKVVLPRRVEKLALRDVLADSLAQVRLTHPCTYQVRGGQLMIVPAYSPMFRPGVNPLDVGIDDSDLVEPRVAHEQIYGGVVSVSADRKPLAEILADLRKQTGANIVLDPRCDAQEKKAALTISLNDVRLYDALRILADMAELKMVYAGNIYYVTTAANVKTFQPPAPRPVAPLAPLPRGGGN